MGKSRDSCVMGFLYKTQQLGIRGEKLRWYHYYHSVDEIFKDLTASETGDVWSLFQNITGYESLMCAVNFYLENERKELLSNEAYYNRY